MGLCFLWNGATLRQVEAWKRSIHLDENGLIDLIEVAWRPLASAVLVQEKIAIREAENHCVWYRIQGYVILSFAVVRSEGALQVRQLGLTRGARVCE
jgi:hypothetical protein